MDRRLLTAEEVEKYMHEGISLIILYKWTAMQLAVDNGWGGKNSREIAECLINELFQVFIESNQSSVYPDFRRLINILRDGLKKLNTYVEEGSDHDMTEELLDLFDDCINEDYKKLEELRLAKSKASEVRAIKVSNGNDDESSDDEDEDDDTCMVSMDDDQTTDMMMVDNCSTHEAMPVDEHKVDDGWTQVTSRKHNKAKRNSTLV